LEKSDPRQKKSDQDCKKKYERGGGVFKGVVGSEGPGRGKETVTGTAEPYRVQMEYP